MELQLLLDVEREGGLIKARFEFEDLRHGASYLI
jgi:hypothetical protein